MGEHAMQCRTGGIDGPTRHLYRDHPDGSIGTYMVRRDGQEVVFEARIYRTLEEAWTGIYTPGWACSSASEGGGLEECDPAAVTRALADLGYGEAERAA